MKKTYKYFLTAFFVGFIIILIVFFQRKEQESASSDPPSKNSFQEENGRAENTGDDNPANTSNFKKGLWQGADKFVLEMSREICHQEQQALFTLTQPGLENIKPGTAIPFDQDSETKLAPSQAIEWLKKTANSKCSSFRKNNAERLYSEFVLDESNYQLFYHELNRILEEYRGIAPYKLIRTSLQTLDNATGEEAQSLREAIIFSVSTYINDSSAFVDINYALMALKEVKEKGLISYPTNEQIDALKKEVAEAGQKHLNDAQQLIRKYFPKNIDFLKLTTEEFVNFYGFEGAKEQLENERKAFNTVREFSRKLSDLMRQNF